MSDEAVLGIISAAVAIAQCVPLFSKGTPQRGKIAAVLSILLVGGGTAYWYRNSLEYQRAVEETKHQVLRALASPKTFDQLLADLYYPTYGSLSDAIDEMVLDNTVEQRRINVVSNTGDTLDVRIYALPSPAKPMR